MSTAARCMTLGRSTRKNNIATEEGSWQPCKVGHSLLIATRENPEPPTQAPAQSERWSKDPCVEGAYATTDVDLGQTEGFISHRVNRAFFNKLRLLKLKLKNLYVNNGAWGRYGHHPDQRLPTQGGRMSRGNEALLQAFRNTFK